MNEDFPEIKTGNGIDRDLATTANDRLKKNITAIQELKGSLDSFSRNSDKYSKRLIYLNLVLIGLTVALIFLAYITYNDAKEQVSSQNNIALNSQFFTTDNLKIINAIEKSKPILLENKGFAAAVDLDNYLGTFDTIESSYRKGFLNESDLCDSFSYYIAETNKNSEIQTYIKIQRKIDSGFFQSLIDLTDLIKTSTNTNCKK